MNSDLFIAIPSGLNQKYKKRRELFRKKIINNYYKKYNITYKFFVGLPLLDNLNLGHIQSSKYSDDEIKIMKSISKEIELYNDIIILPFRDIYIELHLKTINILRWFIHNKHENYIVCHDDRYHLDVEYFLLKIHNIKDEYIYGGNCLWDKPYYEMQKCYDDSFIPYFSGHMIIWNRKLLSEIIKDNIELYGIIGPNSEDMQTGIWVDQFKKKKKKKVLYLEDYNFKKKNI